ncbi:unnamed protein product [Lupinus luteus]|uniref:Trichome birefringence-like C-terminal domain-containing protein n=1 Tax=Lupinus luteus TaxID=3873 RepID=A0AAV1WHS3_LUPLU
MGMKSDMNPLFSLQKKHNHVFLKFTLSFLLVGLTFHLFISDSFTFSSLFQSPSSPLSNATIAQSPLVSVQTNDSLQFQPNQTQPFYKDAVKCDLFVGEWVEPAIEVYHDEEFRSKTWKFPSHNFTLSVIWSPFLIKADIFEDMNGVSSSEIQLYLDTLDDKWTNQYNNFDYVIMSGGKWFLKTAIYHESATITGCHYCPGKNLTELGFEHAYHKALQQVFNFVTSSNHKATVFFRTTTPDHFENGEWFSGGYCNRTVPFKEEDHVDIKDVDSIMRGIEIEEFNKGHGANLKLLDTTYLSLLRPDGHPGPYREFNPFAKDINAKVQNDCLHWCLPGPIDSWNDIVMEMLINNGI